MLDVIGIIIGIALFVFMVFKGINILISAIASSVVMLLFSGMNIMDSLTDIYMAGFGGFLKSYFLLFALSAMLGRLMSDGGGAKKIAVSIAGIIRNSKNNQKLLCALMVPILYFILSYVGISGFVLVFTIMPIAKDLFEETDTPWRFYCFGGPQAVAATMLVGSLQAGNIYAADVCGTDTTAGVVLSVIAVIAWWITTIVIIRIMIKGGEKTNEGFMLHGAEMKNAETGAGISDDKLPNLAVSVLPLAFVIVLSAIVKMNVIPALFISCVVAVVVFWKNLTNIKNTLTTGLTSCYGPVITVAATFAIGSIIKALPAFSTFSQALSSFPGLLSGAGLGVISSFIMASASSPIPVFGEQMLNSYMDAGLSAASAHRMMTITGFSGIGPHNAGISNASAVTKIPYKVCLKIYMLGSFVPGIIALAVAIICVAAGLI